MEATCNYNQWFRCFPTWIKSLWIKSVDIVYKRQVCIDCVYKSLVNDNRNTSRLKTKMNAFVFSLFVVLLSLGQLNAAEVRRDDKVSNGLLVQRWLGLNQFFMFIVATTRVLGSNQTSAENLSRENWRLRWYAILDFMNLNRFENRTFLQEQSRNLVMAKSMKMLHWNATWIASSMNSSKIRFLSDFV